MERPELIVDVHHRVWEYDAYLDKYRCLSVPALAKQTLEYIIDNFGQVRGLNRGDQLVNPFKPIAPGTWVEFDRDVLVRRPAGQILDYDADKLFYRVIINIPRVKVQESE